MINKFQQGGQMDQQQQALVQFIQGIAQVAQVDPQQVMQLAQQEPERLETAVQVFQQTQDIQQAAQAFFQKEAQSAKNGAKLNYLKKLANKCPEGYELRYFKAGGNICSKCVAKKQKGDEIEEAKCGKKMKKDCGGSKINKNCGGKKLQWGGIAEKMQNGRKTVSKSDFMRERGPVEWFYDLFIPKNRIKNQDIQNGVKRTITQSGDTLYMPTRFPLGRDAVELQRDYNKGNWKSNNYKTRQQLPHPLQVNPYYNFKNGGSLKRVPFKQYGGIFGNFVNPSEVFAYNPNNKRWKVSTEEETQLAKLDEKKKKNFDLELYMQYLKKQAEFNRKFNDYNSYYNL